MSTVYAVFREGVYRHECGGVFSTQEAAEACANALADSDVDNYHEYIVVPFCRDVPVAAPAWADGRTHFMSPPVAEEAEVYATKKGAKR